MKCINIVYWKKRKYSNTELEVIRWDTQPSTQIVRDMILKRMKIKKQSIVHIFKHVKSQYLNL